VSAGTIRVDQATSESDVAAFRELCREYAASLPCSAQCSLAHQGFEAEMAGLPGKYAPTRGLILLARVEGQVVGGVALRALDAMPGDAGPVCEMKRMYVRPGARGLGAGRALAVRLLDDAAGLGYRTMKLDTEPDFHAAVGLYRSLGFADVPRYNDDPVSCTLWMARALGPVRA
jgi:putative acetyltransferase